MVCYAIVVTKLYSLRVKKHEGGVNAPSLTSGQMTSDQIEDEFHRKQLVRRTYMLFSVIFIVVLALCIAGTSIDTDEATGGSNRRLRRALV
jgi:hypothetical protein